MKIAWNIDRGFSLFRLLFQTQTNYISTGSSFYTDHNDLSLSIVLTTTDVKKLKVVTKCINFELEISYAAGILNSSGITTQTFEVIRTTYEQH